jgi:hypothetical protein
MVKRSSNPGNKTPKRGQGPPDPNVLAFNIVQQATGQIPKVDPDAGKNPAAVSLGRLGGLKGGAARAKALSPTKRKQIAKKAAAARWLKHKSQPEGE